MPKVPVAIATPEPITELTFQLEMKPKNESNRDLQPENAKIKNLTGLKIRIVRVADEAKKVHRRQLFTELSKPDEGPKEREKRPANGFFCHL